MAENMVYFGPKRSRRSLERGQTNASYYKQIREYVTNRINVDREAGGNNVR